MKDFKLHDLVYCLQGRKGLYKVVEDLRGRGPGYNSDWRLKCARDGSMWYENSDAPRRDAYRPATELEELAWGLGQI